MCALWVGVAPNAGEQRGPREKAGNKHRGTEPRDLHGPTGKFHTQVPRHPFDIVLVRPTGNSITASIVSATDVEGYVEYGLSGGAPAKRTTTQKLKAGQPALFVLNELAHDKAYRYRWLYRALNPAARLEASAEYSFHTPRVCGEAFTFTIQADSHLDQGVEPQIYEQTLANMLADKPDFVIDLGDTFMTDKRGRDFKQARPQYDAQRWYFSRVAHSAPLFMVLGNHDGEKGTSGRDADDIGPWSYHERTTRFPAPVTGDGMYGGSTGIRAGRGSNYYSFEWGDALFVVLDPFWFTTERIRGGGRGDGNGNRDARDRADPPHDEPLKPIDASWTVTLGRNQYDWLARTLETTSARYRFVFTHHLVGGVGGAESRGGVESSTYFEWGGQNADGSTGFATHRSGWPMPIHDLLVKHNVSAVFHGHDHLYVHSRRDGIHYQCVPQPGTLAGGTRSAAHYGYKSEKILSSPGHVRVRIAARAATIEFVRSAIGGAPDENRGRHKNQREPNGAVVDSYDIDPISEPKASR